MTPKLVFLDDRMAVKKVFLGPGNCFLRELAVRLGRQRAAAAQIPQRHVFVRSQLALPQRLQPGLVAALAGLPRPQVGEDGRAALGQHAPGLGAVVAVQ